MSEVSYVVITLNNFISCTGTVLRSNFYEMAECVSFLGLFLNFFSKPTGVVSKTKKKTKQITISCNVFLGEMNKVLGTKFA